MKYIKIILLILCLCWGLLSNAQTVGYTYKALAAEGCNMKYSVAKQDTMYSIVATPSFKISNCCGVIQNWAVELISVTGITTLPLTMPADWQWESISGHCQWQCCNTRNGDKFYRPVLDYSTTV